MSATSSKKKRATTTVRCDARELKALHDAAILTKRSLNSYILVAALEQARKDLNGTAKAAQV